MGGIGLGYGSDFFFFFFLLFYEIAENIGYTGQIQENIG